MDEAATGLLSPRELLGVGAVSSRAPPEGPRGAELFRRNKSSLLNTLRYEKDMSSVRKISFSTTRKKICYNKQYIIKFYFIVAKFINKAAARGG